MKVSGVSVQVSGYIDLIEKTERSDTTILQSSIVNIQFRFIQA
jgi:hypothetical protein